MLSHCGTETKRKIAILNLLEATKGSINLG